MELFTVFETWHLGDGNYPRLEKGQLVNLSFEVDLEELRLAKSGEIHRFQHLGQARYQFVGTVLRVYKDGDQTYPIVVIETGHFRFFYSQSAAAFGAGDIIAGCGTLLFDHFIWVEFLPSYPDPPDLFYKLRVDDIWQRRLPERFITRYERSVAFPTRVRPEDYGPDDVTKVDIVSAEDFVDYVIQFTDENIPDETVARTFCS
jgi:hypothetical protein